MAQVNPGPRPIAKSFSSAVKYDGKEIGIDTPSQLPSIFRRWTYILFWAVMFLFAFHACTHMVAAGDTWVALACGRHFVNHGVNTVEPFSFNSHPAGPTEESIKTWPQWAQTLCKPFSIDTIRYWHPTGWINQNWLTHVMFYWLVEKFGSDGEYNYNALVYWKFGLFFLNVIVVYLLARTLGASVPGSAAAASFAMFVGRTFFDIRPACFANLMAPLFLLVLALAIYRNIRYIWFLVPVTVFWANVHGGYIYIFIMLIPFVLIHLLANLPKKWTLCACSCLLWLILFGLTRQFMANELYQEIHQLSYGTPPSATSIFSDGAFWMILLVCGGCIALTWSDLIPSGLRTTFSIGVSFLAFLILMIRLMISIPSGLPDETLRQVQSFVGGYQFTFVLGFVAMVLGSILLTMAKTRLLQVSNRKIGWIMAAAASSFIAMVLFNPFHLTNLTHTFEISVSKHAASWRSVNEWRPAFNWMDPGSQGPNPVGDEEAFGVLCILVILAAAIWIATRWIRAPKTSAILPDRSNRLSVSAFSMPKIDLAMIVIVALTVLMAIRSRRFIPLAASAACPMIVLMFEQAILAISARRQAGITGRFALPEYPAWLRNGLIGSAGLVLIVFGGYTFGKYKRIYLDPWLPDGKRDSIFMRMTASNVKPFDAGQFIRENRLTGNMFNYWTEGGAIAFFQDPDPETGKTPLQLFMDGRAQAAYNIDKFDLWRTIKGGGLVMEKLIRSGKKLTDQDFRQVGQWIHQELAKHKVWVILMPATEVPYPGISSEQVMSFPNHYFLKALQIQGNWSIAYLDDFQYLYVRNDSPEGKDLLARIFKGEVHFPTESSKHLTLATLYLQTGNEQYAQQALEHAQRAFELEPNQASALRMVYEVRRYPSVRRQAEETLQAFLEDFLDRRDEYAKQGGYCNRLVAARIAANGLIASTQATDPTRAKRYQDFFTSTEGLPSNLSQEAKW